MSFFLKIEELVTISRPYLTVYVLKSAQFKVLREDYHEPLPEITELPSVLANRRHHQGHPCRTD